MGGGGETFTVIVFTLPGEHHHRVHRDDAFDDGIAKRTPVATLNRST